MNKVMYTLIVTLVAVSITGIVFAQGASTPTSAIGAPASAGGAPDIGSVAPASPDAN